MNRKDKEKILPVQEETQIFELPMVSYNERQKKIESYNHCDLCGTELLFTHTTHFVDQQVVEEAQCPCCNIRSKKDYHRLQ